MDRIQTGKELCPPPTRQNLDLVTVAAIAVVAYAIASVLHEGLGHGVTSVLLGGKPRLLSSMNYVGDQEALPSWCWRVVSAGGTLVNLAAGVLAVFILKRLRLRSHWQYFFWIFAAVNLFVGTGYFLFSGFGGIGDWQNVIKGWPCYWGWRVGLAIIGAASYWAMMYRMILLLGPMLSGEPAIRNRTAYQLCLMPYFVGGALYVIAGLFHPDGTKLLFISGVAASFGGTCGFVWAPLFLRNPAIPHAEGEPISLARSWPWIITGLIMAALFIGILGPGIRFSGR